MHNVTDPLDGAEYLITTSPQLDDSDSPANWRDHVIVCGLHNLGFRIAEQLHEAGLRVVIIDDEPDPRLLRRAKRMGAKFIEDDCRIPETLLEAGIKQASALIACEENDLHNLEILLIANDLASGIRLVASFFNQRVGEQLTAAIPNATALSLSEKAGPSFAEACLSSSVLHVFNIKNEEVAVVEAAVDQPAPLQQLFNNTHPLLVREKPVPFELHTLPNGMPNVARRLFSSERSWKLHPPSDYVAQPDEAVILAGPVDTLRGLPGVALNEADIAEAQTGLEAISSSPKDGRSTARRRIVERQARRRRRMAGIRRFISILFSDLERPFRYALIFVGIVILISTLLLKLFYHSTVTTDALGKPEDFSLLDALYFTVTVIATVGFGDYGFAQQEPFLKVYGIVLILVGTASVSVMYAFVTNFIVSRRIEQALGRGRATDMENHIIICGMGSVGYQVLRSLVRQGRQVVVVEKTEQARFVSEARTLGVPIILGDARLADVLRAANIHRAQAIAILTSDDLANMELALNAHAEFHNDATNEKRALRVVVRLFDSNLAERVARNFDIQTIYSASSLAAPYFVGAALSYEVVTTFYLNRQPFVVVSLVVKAGSRLDGINLQEFHAATGMWLLAHLPATIKQTTSNSLIPVEQLQIRQLSPDFHPPASLRLQAGDTIYFIGSNERIVMAYRLNNTYRD